MEIVNVVPPSTTLSTCTAAAVKFDQLLDQRESDAGAFLRACAAAVHAMKAVEQTRQFFVGNADAGIAHGKNDLVACGFDGNFNDPFEGELQCVRKQIENDLLPHVSIDIDRLLDGRAVHDIKKPGTLHRRTERAGKISSDKADIDGLISCFERGPPRRAQIEQAY